MTNHEPQLSVLLVDDEIEACRNLKSILLEFVDPDIKILGVAHNTAEAEKQLNIHNPDAVFLDIEMPNENAFQFLERVAPINFEVVFVTAYDEYAVRAFKLNAVDYILKPISITELANAVTKLKERIKYKSLLNTNTNDFTNVSKQITHKSKLNRITLKGNNNNVELVAFTDILYVEACGKYSKVFFLRHDVLAEILTSYAISDYEELLPSALFYRIHKSFLINCNLIKQIHKDDTTSIVMHHSVTIPVSRRRFSSLLEFLQTKPVYND
ncbi:MAG: response regulator transcription factor [Taibaiella sp.]|nr:response regulator transcription factor [Taibaiella sp.]